MIEQKNTDQVEQFDLVDTFMDRLEASAANDHDSLEAGDEGGPSEYADHADELGELPEEDLAPEQPEDDKESPEPEVDGPEDEGIDDEDPVLPEPAGQVDESLRRYEEIQSRLAAQEQRNQQLLLLLHQQQQAQQHAAQVARQQSADIPIEAMKLALFGASEEAWQDYDPSIRQKAQARAKDEMTSMAEAALDRRGFYERQIAPIVDRVIAARMAPLSETHNQTMAAQIFNRHAGDLEPPLKGRVHEVFSQMPGADSSDWRVLERALEMSVRLAKAETKEKTIAERERKVQTSKRQKDANRKAARRQRSGGRGKSPASNAPKLEPGMDLVKYAEKLRKSGI